METIKIGYYEEENLKQYGFNYRMVFIFDDGTIDEIPQPQVTLDDVKEVFEEFKQDWGNVEFVGEIKNIK